MIRCRIGRCLLIGVVVILSAFFSFNFYILKELNRDKIPKPVELEQDIEQRIVNGVKSLSASHWQKNAEYDDVFYQLELMFKPGVKPLWSKSPAQLWKLVNKVGFTIPPLNQHSHTLSFQ